MIPMTTECLTPAVLEAFESWKILDPTTTDTTSLHDWDAQCYRDAVCFTSADRAPDAWLVRAQTVMHFGLDHYDVAEAYELLPPAPPARPAIRYRRSLARRAHAS
jgi:hypothetical protein